MPVYNHFYLVDNKVDPRLLLRNGILLKVEISPLTQFVKELKKKTIQPQKGIALVDTGASITCVDRILLEALKIPSVGVSEVFTPSGRTQQNIYPVEISFPQANLPKISFNQVLGSKLKDQGIVALIGRDVLQDFILVYNGPGGFVSLAH